MMLTMKVLGFRGVFTLMLLLSRPIIGINGCEIIILISVFTLGSTHPCGPCMCTRNPQNPLYEMYCRGNNLECELLHKAIHSCVSVRGQCEFIHSTTKTIFTNEGFFKSSFILIITLRGF